MKSWKIEDDIPNAPRELVLEAESYPLKRSLKKQCPEVNLVPSLVDCESPLTQDA